MTGKTNLYLNFTGKMLNINRRNGKHSSTDEAKSFEHVDDNKKQFQLLLTMWAKLRGVDCLTLPPPPPSRDFNLYACHTALLYSRL